MEQHQPAGSVSSFERSKQDALAHYVIAYIYGLQDSCYRALSAVEGPADAFGRFIAEVQKMSYGVKPNH